MVRDAAVFSKKAVTTSGSSSADSLSAMSRRCSSLSATCWVEKLRSIRFFPIPPDSVFRRSVSSFSSSSSCMMASDCRNWDTISPFSLTQHPRTQGMLFLSGRILLRISPTSFSFIQNRFLSEQIGFSLSSFRRGKAALLFYHNPSPFSRVKFLSPFCKRLTKKCSFRVALFRKL